MSDFDYIVVGGGSAGCVLASRLSENPQTRVLLLEAGIDTPPGRVPADIESAYPVSAFTKAYQWPNLIVDLQKDGSVKRSYDQARVMGGGSAINAQAANRGVPEDYENWSRMGAEGWGWNDVLPHFRAIESDLQYGGPMHGRDGPVAIQRLEPEKWSGFSHAIADYFKSQGYSYVPDQNGEFEEGYFPSTQSSRGDKRVTTATAFLDTSTRSRRNLKVVPEALVDRVIFDGRRAVGVSYRVHNQSCMARAHEVILCAGAIQTPALLMRSGVGPATHLKEMNIDVVADSSSVGSHLQDHPGIPLFAYLNPNARIDRAQPRHLHLSLRFSSGVANCPPLDMYLAVAARAAWHEVGWRLGLLYVWVNSAFSRGSVRLASPHVTAPPCVNFNLLDDPRDLERLGDAFRFMASAFAHESLRACTSHPFSAAYSSRARWISQPGWRNRALTAVLGGIMDFSPRMRAWIISSLMSERSVADITADSDNLSMFLRQNCIGVKHAAGTCRMGRDITTSATDPRGKVHGVGGLRVTDASLMPQLPRANTGLPTIMMAQKIATEMMAST